MKLKIITAESVPEAMRLVREQLGDDAIILSTVEEPGEVRVTAALEDDPMDAIGGGAGAGPDALRFLDQIRAALSFHRVPDTLLERIVLQAGALSGESALMTLAGGLDSELPFAGPGAAGGRPGIPILLAGPPGAGKTATAAKLGARARMAELAPALISMDTDKAGGKDQIVTFGRAMEAQVRAARDLEGLARALHASSSADLVIVDTPGIDPFDPAAMDWLAEVREAIEARLYCVLPAGLDPVESAEIATAFARAGACGLVATKTDVSRRLGGILNAALASRLELVAAGIAPTIADGLAPLNPVALARLLLPAAAQEEAEDDSSLLATGTQR